MNTNNIPVVKLGIVAVSRDCFPDELSERRRSAVVTACEKKGISLYECKTIVETEKQAAEAISQLRAENCNALIIYLGNFGPETSETLLAKDFDGPVMFAGAAEESVNTLVDGRGDAYCGMLNASYNLALRNVRAYIPEKPVGTADEVADNIKEFIPIAKLS